MIDSVATVRVGGEDYPHVSVSSCHTCASRHRREIESAVLSGRPPGAVVRDLPEGHGLTARHVRDHLRNGHVPADAQQVRQALDRYEQERAEIATQASEAAADHILFARSVLGAVTTRMNDGTLDPTVRDGVAAAGLLARWEQVSGIAGGIPRHEVVAVMEAWMDAAKQVLDRDAMARFGRILDADPLLAAMDAAHS